MLDPETRTWALPQVQWDFLSTSLVPGTRMTTVTTESLQLTTWWWSCEGKPGRSQDLGSLVLQILGCLCRHQQLNIPDPQIPNLKCPTVLSSTLDLGFFFLFFQLGKLSILLRKSKEGWVVLKVYQRTAWISSQGPHLMPDFCYLEVVALNQRCVWDF